MTKEGMMPIDANQQAMWTLSDDRTTVRLDLPPLLLEGLPEPIKVHMEFDAGTLEAILERLTILRSQMLPPLKRN